MASRGRARRLSGCQNRKKAKSLRTVHRATSAVLTFLVNKGVWLIPSQPRLTVLSVDASPALTLVRRDMLACLNRFQEWRARDGRIGNVLEDTVSPEYLGNTREQEPEETWFEAARVSHICIRVVAQLQEEDRWRNVYKCVCCGNWFYARHDPRDSSRPYCGRKCWPSKQSIKSPLNDTPSGNNTSLPAPHDP